MQDLAHKMLKEKVPTVKVELTGEIANQLLEKAQELVQDIVSERDDALSEAFELETNGSTDEQIRINFEKDEAVEIVGRLLLNSKKFK